MSRRPPRPDRTGIWHRCDLQDPDMVSEVIRRVAPTHLVHAAWYVEHGKFWGAPDNLKMLSASLQLFDAFGKAGGLRAIGIGTCGEYAFGREPLNETASPCLPSSVYGRCKAATGLALMAAAEVHGFTAAWARLFFPYGPGAPIKQFIPSLATQLAADATFEMSDGRQVRDFIHVRDIAGAVTALVRGTITGPVNVGTGVGVSLQTVAAQMRNLVGGSGRIALGAKPRATHDPDSIVADITRLRFETGWRPSVPLDDGLANVLANYRALQAGESTVDDKDHH